MNKNQKQNVRTIGHRDTSVGRRRERLGGVHLDVGASQLHARQILDADRRQGLLLLLLLLLTRLGRRVATGAQVVARGHQIGGWWRKRGRRWSRGSLARVLLVRASTTLDVQVVHRPFATKASRLENGGWRTLFSPRAPSVSHDEQKKSSVRSTQHKSASFQTGCVPRWNTHECGGKEIIWSVVSKKRLGRKGGGERRPFGSEFWKIYLALDRVPPPVAWLAVSWSLSPAALLPAALQMLRRYSEGLSRVSESAACTNLGGMKGSTMCLLTRWLVTD